MRNIKLNLEGIDPDQKILKAIGYLTIWAYSGYDEVIIYPQSSSDTNHPDFIANYNNTTNDNQYTIGCVWDNASKTYSFHS
jgi:hypothetical protein